MSPQHTVSCIPPRMGIRKIRKQLRFYNTNRVEWCKAIYFDGVFILFIDNSIIIRWTRKLQVFPELHTSEWRALIEVCTEAALWLMRVL